MFKKQALPMALCLSTSCVAIAGEAVTGIDLSGIDFSKATVISVGTNGVLASLDNAGAVASGEKMKNYGFSAGVSHEKGSFRLGVLLADLQVAANGGNKERTLATAKTLLEGLVALEAPNALVTSVAQLFTAIQHGADPKAVAQLARPMIYPFVKEFIEKEGHLQSFFMGEWAETVYLAASVIRDGKPGNMEIGLRGATFIRELQPGTPTGVIDALKAVAEASKAEKPDARTADSVISAIEHLKDFLG
ncbi:exported hypothetical protein [Gammaproteobacteria bacterium]